MGGLGDWNGKAGPQGLHDGDDDNASRLLQGINPKEQPFQILCSSPTDGRHLRKAAISTTSATGIAGSVSCIWNRPDTYPLSGHEKSAHGSNPQADLQLSVVMGGISPTTTTTTSTSTKEYKISRTARTTNNINNNSNNNKSRKRTKHFGRGKGSMEKEGEDSTRA